MQIVDKSYKTVKFGSLDENDVFVEGEYTYMKTYQSDHLNAVNLTSGHLARFSNNYEIRPVKATLTLT